MLRMISAWLPFRALESAARSSIRATLFSPYLLCIFAIVAHQNTLLPMPSSYLCWMFSLALFGLCAIVRDPATQRSCVFAFASSTVRFGNHCFCSRIGQSVLTAAPACSLFLALAHDVFSLIGD